MDCNLTLMLLVAPPVKLRNASLSSVSEFFVLADSAITYKVTYKVIIWNCLNRLKSPWLNTIKDFLLIFKPIKAPIKKGQPLTPFLFVVHSFPSRSKSIIEAQSRKLGTLPWTCIINKENTITPMTRWHFELFELLVR